MKQGKSLTELAQEIERQRNNRKDYLAPTEKLEMVIEGEEHQEPAQVGLTVYNGETVTYPITTLAHRQVAEKLGIPFIYYGMMMQRAPELLATNVNHWLRSSGKRNLVRTLDNRVRAFLSDRYRRLDNYEVLSAVLPALNEAGIVRVVSSEVTERKMYLKAIFPETEREVKVGDPVQMGVMISNSEVGDGALAVSPFVERLICTNGMVVTELSKRRQHVGRVTEAEDVIEFSDDTLEAEDTAFVLKLRDSVKHFLAPATIDAQVDRFRIAAGFEVEGNVQQTVQVLSDKRGLSKHEGENILQHLIRGGDLSAWGWANAVTRTAADVTDYDRATELEALGGTMTGWTSAQWRELAQ